MPSKSKTILLFSLIFIYASLKLSLAEDLESSSYKIRGDSFTTGDFSGESVSYKVVGDMNPFSNLSESDNYKINIGYNPRIQANTPYPPVLENNEGYYDRLKITLDPSNNPDDTLFAVIISQDNFSTYKYVKSDGTLGDILETEDYLTYASWGSSNGTFILGLNQRTPYKVRAKALNGDFTETEYSNDSNEVKTTYPYINMGVSEASLALGTLNINSISQTSSTTVTINTNAYVGYQVYISDQGNGVYGGLYNGVDSTIMSADMVLTPGFAGYGAQANSISANLNSKYSVFGNAVGGLSISPNPLFSNNIAVQDEQATIMFKATMAPSTIAGNYNDVIYFTVAANL